MNPPWPELPFSTLAARFLVLLLGASLKGSLIFVLVLGATRLMRQGTPRLRHLLWLGALFSFLVIPILSPLNPPLLPRLRSDPTLPDGLYGALSAVLLPKGGIAVPDIRGFSPEVAYARVFPRGPDWAWPLLLLWLAGALASFLRIVAGSLQARLRVAEARRSAPRQDAIVGKLALAAGIRRRVLALRSPSCRVPYARGILHPVIVLPSAARAWRPRRLRAVLLHELRHVKCLDSLTQGIARGVCSLFWFVPTAWLACSFLSAEQEKRCDAAVVRNGVAPRDYAACLLDAARHHPEPALLTGLYSSSWRKRVLVDRIRSILAGQRAATNRWLVFAPAAFVLLVLLLGGSAGSSGSRPLPPDQAYRRFMGVWVNELYPGDLVGPEVRVLRPDRVGEDRLFANSEAAHETWALDLRKAWNDARGNTYCQFSWKYTTGWRIGESWRMGVGLMKVDRAGMVWEANLRWGAIDGPCPESIDAEARQYWNRYFIYYRRQ